MKLRIARGAATDPDETWIYAARSYSLKATEHLVNLPGSRFEIIVSHPSIGRDRPDLGEEVRSLVAGSYRIYYRQEKKGIVRVLHIKQSAPHETKFFGQK